MNGSTGIQTRVKFIWIKFNGFGISVLDRSLFKICRLKWIWRYKSHVALLTNIV